MPDCLSGCGAAARQRQGRLLIDRWKLKIPVAGPIFLNYAVSRFCRVLGTLLRNGVPLLKSLEISSESAGNQVLAEAIRIRPRTSRPATRCRGPWPIAG